MSVAISEVEAGENYDLWLFLSNRVPIHQLNSEVFAWNETCDRVVRGARAAIWTSQDGSRDGIAKQVSAELNLLDSDAIGRGPHAYLACCEALRLDHLVRKLPLIDEVNDAFEYLEGWWGEFWSNPDASDLDHELSKTEALAHGQLLGRVSNSSQTLAVAWFLDEVAKEFPGRPLTLKDWYKEQRRRKVLEIGAKFGEGLSAEAKQSFDDYLREFAEGDWNVPVSGDALAEAKFSGTIVTFSGDELDQPRVAAALLHTAAAVHAELSGAAFRRLHPTHGYAMVIGHGREDEGRLVGVSPGHLRLVIEGDQYVLTCELWPRPVVMSSREFGRARGSSAAILRDVGIAVDAPPGHWKAVWESHGLRNQLLATADRIDPRVRIEEFKSWIHRIALAAPAADRPPANGAAVRLADGATVASPQWLIGQAVADGIVRPHEEKVFEQTLRRNAKETNRRDANRVQQRLLTINAVEVPAGIALISNGPAALIENREEA